MRLCFFRNWLRSIWHVCKHHRDAQMHTDFACDKEYWQNEYFNVLHSVEYDVVFLLEMFLQLSFLFQAHLPVEIWFLCFLRKIQFSSKPITGGIVFIFFNFFCSASLTFWMHKFTELRSVNRHWEEHAAPLLLLHFQHCCMDEKKTASLNVVDWRRNWIWL